MLARVCVLVFTVSTAAASAQAYGAQRQPGTFSYTDTFQQTLVDGTHITRTTHRVTMRDAEGRMRTESENTIPGRPPVHVVNIFDPVAGVTYFFQTGEDQKDQFVRHTYTKMLSSPPAIMTRPSPPARGLSSGSAAPAGSLGIGAVLNGQMAGFQSLQTLQPEIKREDLGFDTVQGISCRSQRTTEVYPVDFFGNDRPITVVRESCTAADFGMLVRSVSNDPRTGTQTMMLDAVTLTNPPASMFQPPPDYTEQIQNSQPQR